MILETSDYFDVATLLDRLTRAARGVVQVMTREDGGVTPIGSGWLVTDDLVMVPTYLVQDLKEAVCLQGETSITARVVARATGGSSDTNPALLRLDTPLKGQALRLATSMPPVDAPAYVLHHPAGLASLKLSMGKILAVTDDEIHYDADTEPGSSGGPVLDARWEVVGMHSKGSSARLNRYNAGVTVTAMRESLDSSKLWSEIAEHQRLADPKSITRALVEAIAPEPAAGGELLAAAVRWDFDPNLLSDRAAAEVEPIVARPRSGRWVLPASTRTTALQCAESLGALRAARGDEPITGPGQAVIDRILQGPPFKLDDIVEAALPYWLQAARWFAGVIPNLPTQDEIRRTLARLRVHSRLVAIKGPHFQGRDRELARLSAWHANPTAGPMVVTGIGGVGKSSLVAAFALTLPPDTLQLWLDFDRADLSADDPESVLRLLFEQMQTQIDGFTAPSLGSSTWQEAVAALASVAAPLLADVPPFLVLDGFEVAQHAVEHREIWQLLEALLPALPGVRVLVSGRAPVHGLTLGGVRAKGLRIRGLTRTDAIAWLLEQGFEHKQIASRLATITRGVPLGLRLAVRWRQEGGIEDDLPDEGAPQWYIDGFLYKRILDRVMDPELVELAKDALVLRRLTPEMIPAVFGDSAPPGDPDEVFGRLAREMALVSDGDDGADTLGVVLPGNGVLRLRPEVRSATLNLLATENADRVRTIDERVASWYAANRHEGVIAAAELVYHRLRLNDVDGARDAWRDGCAPLLRYAHVEVPAGHARDWLRERTAAPRASTAALGMWEHDARERIVELLQRGKLERVAPILEEEGKRSSDSPLTFYDALVLRWNGDRSAARAVLAARGPGEGSIGRDRSVAAAWLAAEDGERGTAEALLSGLDRVEAWTDRPNPTLDAVTVSAAHVKLHIDVGTEVKLARLMNSPDELDDHSVVRAYLALADVVAPDLANRLGAVRGALGKVVEIPPAGEPAEHFAVQLDRARRRGARQCLAFADADVSAELDDMRRGAHTNTKRSEIIRTAAALEHLAWLRWRYAIDSGFLCTATDLAARAEPTNDPQLDAVNGALAAFTMTTKRGEVELGFAGVGSVLTLLARRHYGPLRIGALGHGPKPPQQQIDQAATLDPELDVPLRDASEYWDAMTLTGVAKVAERLTSDQRIVLLHLLSPDPLEMLVRRLAGVSDRVAL